MNSFTEGFLSSLLEFSKVEFHRISCISTLAHPLSSLGYVSFQSSKQSWSCCALLSDHATSDDICFLEVHRASYESQKTGFQGDILIPSSVSF